MDVNSLGSLTTLYPLVAQREQVGSLLHRETQPAAGSNGTDEGSNARSAHAEKGGAKEKPKVTVKSELTPDQQKQVDQLKQIDRKVRAHEQAHIAAGGGVVTGAATFTYAYGPDGKQYATSGEVGINTSAEDEPQDNISKGQQIQRAALAPADPSATDYRVAAAGSELEAKGRIDLSAQRNAEQAAAREAAQVKREEQAAANEANEPKATSEAPQAASAAPSTSTPGAVFAPQLLTMNYGASGNRLNSPPTSLISVYA